MTSAPRPERCRVVVAERSALLRDVVSQALTDESMELVASCDSVPKLIELGEKHRPSVVVVGTSLGTELESAIPTLLANGARAVIVSDAPMDRFGARLLLAGASGYLLAEDLSARDLVHSVSSIASGRAALHPDVAFAVLQQWRSDRADTSSVADPAPASDQPSLTKRELEILHAASEGLTTRAMQKRLGVAQKTIEAHRSRLYAKLGARNQSHAVQIGAARGLLDPASAHPPADDEGLPRP